MAFAQEAISTRGGSRDSPTTPVHAATVESGIEFPVALTSEILGNLSGGTSRAVIWESLLNVGVAIDLEKIVGWKGGSVSARGIYPQGQRPNDRSSARFQAPLVTSTAMKLAAL